MLEHGMNEKITWLDEKNIKFPIFRESEDSIIYQLNANRLVKIYKDSIGNEKRERIAKVVQYFLNHPSKKDIVPLKAWLSNDGFIGYEMVFEQQYQPLSQQLDTFDEKELESLLYLVEKECMEHRSEYIYTDIDVDNILYWNGHIKWIDFDDCLITNTLSEYDREKGLEHQQSVFRLFALSLLYHVSLADIYYLEQTEQLSLEQKKQVQEILAEQDRSLDALLTKYHALNRQK